MVKASVRNGYMLILFLLFAFALNATVMIGNDFIARATDLMLSGESVDFSKFMILLFWMMGLGTVSAYLKSIFGNHYSAMVQRDVRLSLEKHLIRLPFSYFDEKGTGTIVTRLISDMEEMGRFFRRLYRDYC